jgi:hypothetical protein
MAIQTRIRTDRGEWEDLHPNDPRYWEGRYVYEAYPKLLFRATEAHYQTEDLEHCVVNNEQEHRARGSAWKESPDEARAYFDALEGDVARTAAEVKYAARGMSRPAQDELREAEQATDEFVTDVTPKKRAGWPKGKPRGKKTETTDGQ